MLEPEMSEKVSENMQLVQRAWIDSLSNKRTEEFASLHSETVVMYDATLPQTLRGRDAIRNWMEKLFVVFPDYQLKKVRIFGQNQWVCLEGEDTGTMMGPMHRPGGKTVQPTNKSFKIPSSTICRIEEGKIAEVHSYFDDLNLMTQLGIAPI